MTEKLSERVERLELKALSIKQPWPHRIFHEGKDIENRDWPTPRALFKHLERIGSEIPQWLRDEPEMQSLDHVPSKATRCAIIWQAMVPAFQQENRDDR